MEGLEVLVETPVEQQEEYTPYLDVEHLKGIKETSQVFLKENGYLLKEPDFSDMTEEQFIRYIKSHFNDFLVNKFKDIFEENFRSIMSNIYHHSSSDRKILIFFLPTSENRANVGIETVKNFCKLIILTGCNEGVLITEKSLTPKSKEHLESSNIKNDCRENVYNVISYLDEKFINIVDHCLSPKVLKIYSGEELKKFEEENKVDTKFFPRMFTTDPVAKFYCAKPGDVIMMKRKTGTINTLVKEQIIYRKVVYEISKEVRK